MKENNENDLISRRALYDKCVELEQEALKMVLTTDDKIEKLIWNAVLAERSAFKFSVMDAPASLDNPSAKSEQKIGHWIDTDNYYQRWKCSECGCHTRDAEPNYCPHCGTKMEREN